MPGYALLASPTLHPGQTMRALLKADEANAAAISCQLYLRFYGTNDQLERSYGPQILLAPGERHELYWQIGDLGGAPIAEIGVELSASQRSDGTVYLDELDWGGAPNVVLRRPAAGGTMWRRAWVDAVDQFGSWWPEAYRLVQNEGTGLLMQGSRNWTDYQVKAAITPHLAKACGIAARVQGLKRYYVLQLASNQSLQLVKMLDGETVLAEVPLRWEFGRTYELRLEVVGDHIRGWLDGRLLIDLYDRNNPLKDGGIALVCTEGRIATEQVEVQPAEEG